MKFLFTTLTFLILSLQSFAQDFEWATNHDLVDYSSALGPLLANDVAIDPDGNIYAAGQFAGTVAFGVENITATLLAGILSSSDGYLAKYDADGNFLWVKILTSMAGAQISNVELDNQGNIYFAATASEDAQMGSLSFQLGGSTSSLIGKLDPSGNPIWINELDQPATPNPSATIHNIKVFNDKLYATGYYTGTLEFGDNALSNDQSYFLAQFNTEDGTANWGNALGGTTLSAEVSVDVDVQGNVYCSGYMSNTADFGGISGGIADNITSYVAKFNAAGVGQWVKQPEEDLTELGSSFSPRAIAVGTDAVYITGSFNVVNFTFGSVSISQIPYTGSHLVLIKMNMDGNVEWMKHSKQDANATFIQGVDLEVFDNDEVMLTGQFQNGTGAYFNTTEENFELSAENGSVNAFIIRFDKNGNYKWGIIPWAPEDGAAVTAIAISGANQVVICGGFDERLNAGSIIMDAVYPDGFEKGNMFVAKIDGDLSVNIDEFIDDELTQIIFPNPTSEYIILETKSFVKTDVEIFNQLGQLVRYFPDYQTGSKLQLSDLPSGQYFVKMTIEGNSVSKKLITN